MVIQPASNNEGEDDQSTTVNETVDVQEEEVVPAVDVSSPPPAPTAMEQSEEVSRADDKPVVSAESTNDGQQQSAAEVESANSQTMPPRFMYKVRNLWVILITSCHSKDNLIAKISDSKPASSTLDNYKGTKAELDRTDRLKEKSINKQCVRFKPV